MLPEKYGKKATQLPSIQSMSVCVSVYVSVRVSVCWMMILAKRRMNRSVETAKMAPMTSSSRPSLSVHSGLMVVQKSEQRMLRIERWKGKVAAFFAFFPSAACNVPFLPSLWYEGKERKKWGKKCESRVVSPEVFRSKKETFLSLLFLSLPAADCAT